MKPIASFLAMLCLFQSSFANTAVPDAISYQGRALTAAGALLGAGTPVNRTVTFRIWDHASNSLADNLIYAETQVVTIADGEFSVLVGTGAATGETTKVVKISDAFGGASRYLGVTLDDGTTAVDNEISPRQQIVSGAFSLRSKFAESIGSGSDLTLTPLSTTTGNYGLGWYGASRPFGATIVDGPVLYGTSGGALGSIVGGTQNTALRWDAKGSVGIGATTIASTTNKLTLQGDMATTPGDQLTIRGNADNNKRLLLGYDTTANRASLQSYTGLSTTGPLLLNPSGGNVGIGTSTPNVPLTFAATTGNKISLYGGLGGEGIGIQASLLQIYTSSSISDIGFGYGSSTAMTETMRIKGNGNVGINNTSPLGKFTVNSGSGAFTINSVDVSTGAWIRQNPDGLATVFSTNSGDMWFGWGGNAKNLRFQGGGTHQGSMVVTSSGNVGIGTVSPSAPLHVTTSASNTTTLEAYLDQAGASNVSFTVTHPYSIIASSRVRGLAFDVQSDRRIKNSQKLSEGREDLATLMKIEVTDYLYKDTVANGTRPQKKVIAQQVEAVYSQAITQSTEAIPDLYLKAAVKDGWVELATDLKKGERVKLIGGKEECVHEVLEVGDGKFRTDFKSDGEVFVYGREVNDFRSVDYDAISMLNVSATQQIKREKDVEIQTLRDENAALRRELAAKDASLEAKDASLEARMIALERRMSAEGATETVSLKTAQAVK